MKIKKYDVLFGTSDLGLAAALLCEGFKIVDLTPAPEGERVTFYFKPVDTLDAASKQYWAGELKVDAKRFWSEQKNLKSRIYASSGTGGGQA